MLDEEELRAIHKRLIEREPTASADLFLAVLEPLVRFLLSLKYKGLDVDSARHIGVEIIANFAERPEQYVPEKGSLSSYLFMAAKSDALNQLKKLAREQRKLDGFAVELDAQGGNYEVRPDVRLDALTIWAEHGASIVKDEGDAAVLQLILEDVREYEQYAVVLGLTHKSQDEQVAEIKRRKDRIEKRLARVGEKYEPK